MKKKEEVEEKEEGKEPEEKEKKIADWKKKGFFEAVVTIQTTSQLLGTRPDETKDDLCVFPRGLKGAIQLPEGYIRGVMRESAPFLNIPKTLKDHIGISDVVCDAKKTTTIQYTGSPSGRGVVGLYEALPAGTIVQFKILVPGITHNPKILKRHMELAGKYVGLGALRKQGYGRFELVKLDVKGKL